MNISVEITIPNFQAAVWNQAKAQGIALQREFMEEMELRVEVGEHIYTTDFYQDSAFNPDHQIISIYYFVKALEEIKAPLRIKPFDFDEQQLGLYAKYSEIETFRFIERKDFGPDCMTLPIDKIVAAMV